MSDSAPFPPPSLSRRERWWLAAGAVVYAAVAIPLGVHKGSDLTRMLVESWSLVQGGPLYDRALWLGTWWPPFALASLAPLALVAQLSMPLAKGIFAALTVACIAWSVGQGARVGGWRVALLALLAVSKPMQTNAESLNINAILLVLFIATILELRAGRETRAGVWIGVATALKAFPALFLLYFALQRRWRGFAAGIAVAGGLTVLAMLRYGVVEGAQNFVNWVTLSANATMPADARTSQSLEALLLRLGAANGVVISAKLLLLAVVAVALRRFSPTGRRAWFEIGVVTLAVVLVSPIAWDHYYLLFFPAWVALLVVPAPPRRRGLWHTARVIAAIGTSGIVLALVPTWLRWQILLHSAYAWAALLVLTLLLVSLRWTKREDGMA